MLCCCLFCCSAFFAVKFSLAFVVPPKKRCFLPLSRDRKRVFVKCMVWYEMHFGALSLARYRAHHRKMSNNRSHIEPNQPGLIPEKKWQEMEIVRAHFRVRARERETGREHENENQLTKIVWFKKRCRAIVVFVYIFVSMTQPPYAVYLHTYYLYAECYC